MAPLIDKTGLFRELLKETQVKNENFKPDKSRILQRKEKDPLEVKAHVIIEHTTKLKEFLHENRTAYIDILNRDFSAYAMTDIERDRIDAGANNLIRTINALVEEFKKDLRAKMTTLRGQHTSHLEAVSDILDADLKLACQSFSEQKAIRVQKELEIQKLSRLEIKAKRTLSSPDSDQEELDKEVIKPKYNWALEQDDDSDSNEPLSPAEMQMFDQENEKMYEDLMTLKDEVQQIETKVVKIAELQQIFTEKVLQQKGDIDLIASNAVATTENVSDGNEEIRKAIQRNASTRVYVLFFLIVMSFTLLFLDWYNE